MSRWHAPAGVSIVPGLAVIVFGVLQRRVFGSVRVGPCWIASGRLGPAPRGVTRAGFRSGIALRAPAAGLHRRPRLFPRAGAGSDDVQGTQRLEARQSQRRRRSRQLVGALSRFPARYAAARSRDLQSDGGGGGRGLRAIARHRPRSAIGAVSDARPPATASPARAPERSPAPPAAAPSGFGLGTRYTTQYSAPINGSWDLDVWGKVRRTIEADASAAQASAADLDNAKLSAQAQLATAYFNLLAADLLRDLLHRSAAQFRETYQITLNKFNAGYGPTATTGTTSADVALAQSQVLAIEAQELSVGVQRAQFEHAIAVLIGRPPAELTIGPRLLGGRIPKHPGRGALDAARTASRYRRRRAHHAEQQRADRRRRSGLFPGRVALGHGPVHRSHSAAVFRRALDRSRSARARRKRCSTAG